MPVYEAPAKFNPRARGGKLTVLSEKCCRIGPKLEDNACVRAAKRKPLIPRSRSRVGGRLLLARLLTRAAASTNKCMMSASADTRPLAAG